MENIELRVWDREQKKFLEIGDSEGQAKPNYYNGLFFTLVGKKDEDGYDYEIDADILLLSDKKDRNQKRICEDDIIRVNKFIFQTSGPLPENLVVKFYDGMFQLFRGKESLMGLHLSYVEDCEIIGDIRQNPEIKFNK